MGHDHFIFEGIFLDEHHSYTLVELVDICLVENSYY